MPRGRKPRSFEEIICERYPEAEDLASDRIFSGRSFFDTKSHRALHDDELILAALYLADTYARQVGAGLVLTNEEQNLWQRRFGKRR